MVHGLEQKRSVDMTITAGHHADCIEHDITTGDDAERQGETGWDSIFLKSSACVHRHAMLEVSGKPYFGIVAWMPTLLSTI